MGSCAVFGRACLLTAGLARSVGLREGMEENGNHRLSCLLLCFRWIEVPLGRQAEEEADRTSQHGFLNKRWAAVWPMRKKAQNCKIFLPLLHE